MAKVDSDRFLFCFEFSGRGTGWKKWDHLAGKYKLELKKSREMVGNQNIQRKNCVKEIITKKD